METNDALRKTLLSLAGTGIETLVRSVQEVREGNLQELEQQILIQTLAPALKLVPTLLIGCG
jgi:hypothetical protein